MTDTDRLAAALHATMGNTHKRQQYDPWCPERAAAIIAADPTIICPDPADHALADAAKVARAVAQVWLDAVMASDVLRQTGMSHPLSMVLTAFDGVTDPVELGCNADALTAALETDR